MKIFAADFGKAVRRLELELTHQEASELRDALDALVSDVSSRRRHEHVASEDFETELTVWIGDGALGIGE